MYFNDAKTRPVGAVLVAGKLAKKTYKSLEQLKRHDPDVRTSSIPTNILFVANSSVLCNVSLEELEEIFCKFDSDAQFVVFPNRRAYSFVELSSVEAATAAREAVNGHVPEQLKKSHLPFLIEYVENLPLCKAGEGVAGPVDLVVADEILSEEEEKELADMVESDPRLSSMKHRSVVHWGHAFDYSSNCAFVPTAPIPPLVEELIQRLKLKGLIQWQPDQVTANVYSPGQGIPSHFDTHSAFEDPVVSVSLLADVVMEFKDAANSARIAPVLLKRRSLCLMEGDARYRWKHGIVNRQHDICPLTNRVLQRHKRISLTLRKIRHEPCRCAWKEFCDWDRDGEMGVPSSEGRAATLEDNYVADVYENIAPHFDETRHSTWKGVRKFLDSLAPGSLLYDVGCGNGKYLHARDDGLVKIGIDRCNGLCSIAAAKGCFVARGEALGVPLRGEADAAISIAVLHHMSTRDRRRRAIEEIMGLLRVGGRACVTVWSMQQEGSEYAKMRDNKETTHDEIDNAVSRLRVHDGRSFYQQDVLVPWTVAGKEARAEGREGEQTFLRFYHVFAEGEMEDLVKDIEGCEVESVEWEQGNWIAVLRRIQ